MKKRIVTLFLAVIMGLMLVPSVSAVDMIKAQSAADTLNAFGLFDGVGTDVYGKPIYNLSRTATKQEAVMMLVRFLGKDAEAHLMDWKHPYTDVDEAAKPYVGYAYANGLITEPGTVFGANETVTAAQYITYVLRALGYSSAADFKADSPWDIGAKVGLFKYGEYSALNNTSFKRGDIAIISLNAMSVKHNQTGVRMIDKAYGDYFAAETSAVKLDWLVDEICKERKKLYSSINDYNSINKYATTSETDKYLVSKAELDLLGKKRSQRTVTYAEAVADIDLYFRTFKAGYGAYYYFGDAAFKQIKANILAELEGMATVTASQLDNLIKKHMAVIRDGHLKRGDVDEYEYLYCEDLQFMKDNKGYYKYVGDIKWYYEKCDSPYVKMVPTLTDAGAVVYSLAWTSNGSNIVKRNLVTLSNRGKTMQEVVEWKQARAYTKSNALDYKYLEENGIAYISIRSFDNAHGASNYNDFMASGYGVRDCDVIIMDLRANGGGTTNHPSQWVKNYTNSGTGTWQMTTMSRGSAVGRRAEYGQDSAWAGTNRITLHKNENLIIVLVDDLCGSAGEFAMQMMRTIDNSVVIGSPSKGCTFCCGSLPGYCLPNSGINYSFGTTMYWLNGEENRDDMGIEPDIWCDPSEALDAVFMLLVREGKMDIDTMMKMKNSVK